ncbi:MAG: patatin-like phospholipase family protein, partial [Maricaulaceae bacterium]
RALKAAEGATRWFSLPGGAMLFDVGEEADEAYFLIAGSLVAHRPSPRDDDLDIVGHIRPGEPVGEMAMLAGEKHTAAVSALRDSELLALSRKDFFRLARAHPEFYEGLSRLILLRSRAQRTGRNRTNPKVFALLATSPSIDVEGLARTLAETLGQIWRRCVVVGSEASEQHAGWFDQLEHENDVVILTSRIEDSHWYRVCLRQADRLWVLARRDARPSHPMPLAPAPDSPARRFRLVDVITLPLGASSGASPAEWMEEVGAARIFHWRTPEDVNRLARTMAGLSVGVVLSGGGARAYAHIGALQAIREAGLPLDFVGGTSMGAIIAAGVAIGWSHEELTERVREAFVESNPLGDFRLPVIALAAGERVNARLLKHFGDARIEELPLPFFAVSSNLTTGGVHVHRTGLLREALRASISLPGILPPIVQNGEVLVDGAVLSNFPVETMRAFHRGPVIGVDVAREARFDAADFVNPPNFFGWVIDHGFHDAPPIASLLMRAATVNTDISQGRESVDVLVAPELGEIDIRDWKTFDETIDTGYQAAKAALAERTGRLDAVRVAMQALERR